MLVLVIQVLEHLLECTRCGNVVHPACLVPPLAEKPDGDWFCYGCGEKTTDYQRERRRYITEVWHRYGLQAGPLRPLDIWSLFGYSQLLPCIPLNILFCLISLFFVALPLHREAIHYQLGRSFV